MAHRVTNKLLLASCTIVLAACTPQPSLSYRDGAFIAEGVTASEPAGGWAQMFPVTSGDGPNAQPLLGTYKREGSRLVFTPEFSPAPGASLHATLITKERRLTHDITIPQPDILSTTTVLSIHPAAETWPENTLRMYVTFSAPMRVGEAWTHITLRDARGDVIEHPFVEIDQELWDPERRRLTILFDPGRIKRGLVDNETAGPPLVPGRDVTLTIDPAWRDAAGAPLSGELKRTLHVSAAERRPLATGEWRITYPAKPDDDLVIRFGRPMDSALALRALTIKRGAAAFDGKSQLADGDTTWRFTPSSFWPPGFFEIHVDGVIEDVAGNRLGRPFDVDMRDPKQSRPADARAVIPFTVEY